MTYYPRLPEEVAEGIRKRAEIAAVLRWRVPPQSAYGIPWGPDVREHEEERRFVERFIDNAVASAQLNHSLAGRFGHLIEPTIRPLGYDWKMGIGLIGAFAAREVFVSTLAITYAAGDGENTADLSTAMRADTYPDGRPVWTTPVALSLLVWFVLAMQCMSTLAIVRRETGGWRWPIFMLAYMNGLAYVVSLGVYHLAMWV